MTEVPSEEATHLVKFELQGPEVEDDRGYPRRQTLIEVEMRVNPFHGANVVSTLLELLSRQGALVIRPLTAEEAAEIAAEWKETNAE